MYLFFSPYLKLSHRSWDNFPGGNINKPIGVSSFITREIPFEVKSQLPTVEQLEQELKDMSDD
jgi:hypothetical protein